MPASASPASSDESTRRARRSTRIAGLLVLVVLPLWLRLAPVDHGASVSYVPDTHMVRQALGMARDHDPFPPVGKYSTYPYLVPYLLLPIYAGEYAIGRVAGAWGSAEEFGTRAMLEPELVFLPARGLVAVLGALTAWVVFRAARAAGLGRGAWVAAWLVATGCLHLQFSVHERPWVPMVFFGALAAWPAARYGQDAERRWLVLSGAAAGLSFACHQAGLVMLGLAGVAWAFGPLGFTGAELRRRIVDGTLAVGGFLLAGLAFGHSYYLIHGGVEDGVVSGGEAAEELVQIGGQAVRFEVSLDSFRHLSRAFVGYDPALVLLMVAGLFLGMKDRRMRPFAVLALGYAAFFMTNVNDHVRYLLPLTVLGALPAGLAAEALLRKPGGRALLVGAGALALVQAVRLGWVLQQPDTRVEAEQALHQLGGDARIAIDHYGPVVPLSQASLEWLAQRRDLRTREAKRYEFLVNDWLPAGERGVDAIYVEEFLGVDPQTGAYGVLADDLGPTIDAALRSLDVTHVLVADRRPRTARTSALHAVTGGEPLRVFDPSPDGTATEALLPTDMDFPLTGLWQVDRPGPRLALYALPRP